MNNRFLGATVIAASCGIALSAGATEPAQPAAVTVYGSIDLGIASVSNVAGRGRVTGLQNGGFSSSRLGFKGGEDIGGGNAINFQLESDVLADVGSAGTGALFARAAWVGASGAWGELRLGRNYTESYEIAAKYDPMSGANFGGLMAVFESSQTSVNPTSGNLFTSYGNARVDNSVHYRTRSMAGLVARITWAAGETAGSTKANSQLSGAFDFNHGPFDAAVVYGQAYAAAADRLLFRHTAGYVRYDAGFARLVAGHTDSKGLGPGGGQFVTTFIGTNVPLAPALMLNGFYARADNLVLAHQPHAWSLRADYFLSRRSVLYAGYAGSRQDDGSRLNIVNLAKFSSSSGAGNQPNAGDNQAGLMAGLRHAF